MTFTTTNLRDHRVLVSGTDVTGTAGQVVLDGRQWHELTKHQGFSKAEEKFNKKVEKFFAPLVKAADEYEKATAAEAEDELGFIVLQEEVVGQKGKAAIKERLTHDSIILRLLEAKQDDRLIWVNGALEVTA